MRKKKCGKFMAAAIVLGSVYPSAARPDEPLSRPTSQYDFSTASSYAQIQGNKALPTVQANNTVSRPVRSLPVPAALRPEGSSLRSASVPKALPIPDTLQAYGQGSQSVSGSSQMLPGGSNYANSVTGAAPAGSLGTYGADAGMYGGAAGTGATGATNALDNLGGAGTAGDPGLAGLGAGAGTGAGTGYNLGDGLDLSGLEGEAANLNLASGGAGGAVLPVQGDQNPFFLTHRARPRATNGYIPPTPSGRGAPLLRQAFKMDENQTPRPVTRFFYSFNYFNNVNQAFNIRDGASISAVQLYHSTFGYEQAFAADEQGVPRASIGARLPYDLLSYRDPNGLHQSGNAVGDLSVYGKYMFWYQPDMISLASVGLMTTTPTGPNTFARAPLYIMNRTVFLQPFVGYRFKLSDRAYFQGFSSIDIPLNGQSGVMMYNDFQLAYFAYRSKQQDAFLTSIVPLMEVHINTPFNHRGYSPLDPFYAIDVVSMTWGAHAVLGNRVTLSGGVGTPITGVHPYSVEALAMLNIAFGGRKTQTRPLPFLPNL